MKKLVLIAATCTLFLTSFSQPFVKMGAGASFGRSPEIEAFAGYNWPLLNVSAGMQVHTTNKVIEGGALLQVRFGHILQIGESWAINPYVGAAHNYRSAERKNLNITKPLFGIEIDKKFREDIGIYGAFSKTGSLSLASIGVIGYF